MTINNLQYLKGFFEACYGQKQSVTFDADKVADILDHINAAITEASVVDKIIPAIQPAQIPLPFPAVPFKPYDPIPGSSPFSPYQPTITPNSPHPAQWPNTMPLNPFDVTNWPGINQEDKYRWIDKMNKPTCETIGVGYSLMGDSVCRDPFELDASTGSTTDFVPNPVVMAMFDIEPEEFNGKPTADKLVAIIRDESRASALEERKARSDERTKNYGRPEKGYARD